MRKKRYLLKDDVSTLKPYRAMLVLGEKEADSMRVIGERVFGPGHVITFKSPHISKHDEYWIMRITPNKVTATQIKQVKEQAFLKGHKAGYCEALQVSGEILVGRAKYIKKSRYNVVKGRDWRRAIELEDGNE